MTTLGSNIKRSLNHLIVEGSINSWFFRESYPFELHVYYSNKREIILEIKIISSSVKIEDLNLTFEVGDDIKKAYDWVEKNNWRILVDFKK